ncbi:MAG: rhodanese-like domain-containing protein [Minwuia sp.]|uniref:rhodanese-like domain-containing protein n=1 Tax=Minwuia sp. TaxID=2493630 RepID=UPI003A86C232
MRVLTLLMAVLLPFCALAETGVMSPDAAWRKAEAGELLIIDIRTPPEWAWSGTPRGSARVNWLQLSGEEGFLKDVLEVTNGDRSRPLALICASGGRSSSAAAFLAANGFSQVADIGEGMGGSRQGPGWLARKLPLE